MHQFLDSLDAIDRAKLKGHSTHYASDSTLHDLIKFILPLRATPSKSTSLGRGKNLQYFQKSSIVENSHTSRIEFAHSSVLLLTLLCSHSTHICWSGCAIIEIWKVYALQASLYYLYVRRMEEKEEQRCAGDQSSLSQRRYHNQNI